MATDLTAQGPGGPAVDAATPPVLDYGVRRPARRPDDRGLLLAGALVTGLIGLALLAGMADLLIVTWPSFGVTLMAVPVAVAAFAFFVIAATAVRLSLRSTFG